MRGLQNSCLLDNVVFRHNFPAVCSSFAYFECSETWGSADIEAGVQWLAV